MLKKGDIILIIFILLLAIGFIGMKVFSPKTSGSEVLVTIAGKPYATYPLKKDGIYKIPVGEHFNTIQISDAKVKVIDADCPDKLCVKQGKISFNGETIVCLPNKLVVEITGGAYNDQLDAISQ